MFIKFKYSKTKARPETKARLKYQGPSKNTKARSKPRPVQKVEKLHLIYAHVALSNSSITHYSLIPFRINLKPLYFLELF